jgi:DNA helicase II / ATP-dependent DNA helicase PcrA
VHHLILGPPGTGKTTRLLGIMRNAMATGIPPAAIAFVSFTRAAVQEARDRAIEQFGLAPDALPYFRTLHSLCFKQLGMRSADVFTRKHYEEFGELVGEQLTGALELDAPAADGGDGLLHLDQFARVSLCSLRDAWDAHGGNIDWWRLRRFSETYALFRQDQRLVDFTDMLEQYAACGDPAPVQLAIIDEAQDLTPLQWQVVRLAFSLTPDLYAAGDDDQTIYKWSGADPAPLIGWSGSTEVLPVSYRLPRRLHAVAEEIASRIVSRAPKVWQPLNKMGELEFIRDPDEVDLSSGEWLLLARTRRQLTQLRETARYQGVAYTSRGLSSVDPVVLRAIRLYEHLRAGRGTIDPGDAIVLLKALGRSPDESGLHEDEDWDATTLGIDTAPIWHDALVGIPLSEREYYLACMRRGERLTEKPRVRIETIHGAKGLEADHVLLTTSTTARIQRGFDLDPDSEHRVFYVGATRARESLWIMQPNGPHGYQI